MRVKFGIFRSNLDDPRELKDSCLFLFERSFRMQITNAPQASMNARKFSGLGHHIPIKGWTAVGDVGEFKVAAITLKPSGQAHTPESPWFY